MFKNILKSLMALALVVGISASLADPADAHGRGGRFAAGVAAGIIGLGLLGAAAEAHHHHEYDRGDRCYPGPEECGWRNRRCFENRYGEVVCRGGRWTCWRPTYCD